MIPRIIHQLWINPKPEDCNAGLQLRGIAPEIEKRCLKWRSLYPAYLYRLWSLEEVLAIADDDQVIGNRVRAVIQALRFPAAQADVARLMLLSTFGGFWVDLKLDPYCRFLTPLLDFDVVLTEHFPQSNRPEPNGLLINGFIGSDRQTQFIDRVLKRVSIERRAASSNLDLQCYRRNEFAKSERRDGQPPWRDWKPYSFAAYRNLGETPLVGIGTV